MDVLWAIFRHGSKTMPAVLIVPVCSEFLIRYNS